MIISYYFEEVDVLVDWVVIIDKGVVIVIGIFLEFKDWVGGDCIILCIREFFFVEEVERVKILLVFLLIV